MGFLTVNFSIKEMFDSIASQYDLANRILSLGQDVNWRMSSIKRADIRSDGLILDAATGTGDMAVFIAKNNSSANKILGIDFSKEMIRQAVEKAKRERVSEKILFHCADIENLPFKKESFRYVFIAFGLRNLSDVRRGLKEFYRILKKDGKLSILEFSAPKQGFISTLSWFYVRYIVPFVGTLTTGRYLAYKYLSQSILNFFTPEDLKKLILDTGFRQVSVTQFGFGVVNLYLAIK